MSKQEIIVDALVLGTNNWGDELYAASENAFANIGIPTDQGKCSCCGSAVILKPCTKAGKNLGRWMAICSSFKPPLRDEDGKVRPETEHAFRWMNVRASNVTAKEFLGGGGGGSTENGSDAIKHLTEMNRKIIDLLEELVLISRQNKENLIPLGDDLTDLRHGLSDLSATLEKTFAKEDDLRKKRRF